MANRLESGFVKGDSRSLPKIDTFMVYEFIDRNDKLNAAEIRNAKTRTRVEILNRKILERLPFRI